MCALASNADKFNGAITQIYDRWTKNKFRDRAFHAMLDNQDYGDFNLTYFRSTVGFLTLLLMSGNFPTP